MHHKTWLTDDGEPYVLLKPNFKLTNTIQMVLFKDLSNEIGKFRIHLRAVSTRVNDEQKMKILMSYVDNLQNSVEVVNNWNMILFDHENIPSIHK